MKRFFLMFAYSFLLLNLACQPTPEVEFVVNKGDDVVGEKLAAPQDGATEQRQTFPDRWDEGPVTVNDRLTLTVQAEVVEKADGLYPVYRTRQHAVTQEEVVALVEQLLPPPTSVTIPVDTKADWQQSYQEWLDDLMEQQAWVTAGKPQDGMDRDEAMMSAEEIDRISKEYQRLIAEAPDELTTTPVSDYSGLKLNEGARVYELADGSKATVEAMADSSFMSVERFRVHLLPVHLRPGEGAGGGEALFDGKDDPGGGGGNVAAGAGPAGPFRLHRGPGGPGQPVRRGPERRPAAPVRRVGVPASAELRRVPPERGELHGLPGPALRGPGRLRLQPAHSRRDD